MNTPLSGLILNIERSRICMRATSVSHFFHSYSQARMKYGNPNKVVRNSRKVLELPSIRTKVNNTKVGTPFSKKKKQKKQHVEERAEGEEGKEVSDERGGTGMENCTLVGEGKQGTTNNNL